tara:strand:+ start:632 stop:1312 length:681 start_codon:yes stop_codon:yes gene_type:complete
MSKTIKIFLFLSIILLVFNKKLITYYYTYKLSKWIERPVVFDKFNINYPNLLEVTGIKIKNSNKFYNKNIFESDKIVLDFNLKSFLFSDLIIINNLDIENPKFFLDIVQTNKKSLKNGEILLTYEDNIGLAKKINENTPDKIWPPKKKDINFLILKTSITGGRAFIRTSFIAESAEIKLSDMNFKKIGNEKNFQHYKEVLKFILFDIMSGTNSLEMKKILKLIYNL